MMYSARGEDQSIWLSLPRFLVLFIGADVALFLVLAALKLDFYPMWKWWIVLLPITAAVCLLFAVFAISCLGWIVLAARMVGGHIEVDIDREPRLDVLFRTAKICFLGQGYTGLLLVAVGLLLMKLNWWPSLPVVYPLLPLIALGAAYIFLAIMLRQPEVDSPWFFVVGLSMLSQSILLVLKLDHLTHFKSLPWAVVFTPSWLTYTLVLVFCILSPLQLWPELIADHEAAAAGENPTFISDGDRSGGQQLATSPGMTSSSNASLEGRRFRRRLCKCAGLACWAIGWSITQILLALHFDGHGHRLPWTAVLLPALVGWVLLLLLVTELVSNYFIGIVSIVMDTFGLGCKLPPSPDIDSEQAPLLAEQRLPWR